MRAGTHLSLHGPPPPTDLLAWEEAWEPRGRLDFQQHWLPQPEADFLPGWVKTGWSDQAWHILAVMTDQDIHNPARTPHEASWVTGDCFEIFFRPSGQESYFEIHVTPENSGIRVRFPSTEFRDQMARTAPPGSPWVFDLTHLPPGLHTQSLILQDENRWLAGVSLAFADYLENGETGPGADWAVSFCRYDHDRDRPEPVLSSTSPLLWPKFHQQDFWMTERFTRP